MGTSVYVAIAITLCALGLVAIFSVGAPLFLTGIAMLVASPWRGRREIIVPIAAAPWAFTLTYALLAPLSCTSTPSTGPLLSRTECSNVLGIDHSGGDAYDPPLLPALLSDLVVAGVTVLVLRQYLTRRRVDAR